MIASDIPGNVGLLGRDYPGYYPVGDTSALREILLRAEVEPKFLKSLASHCKRRAPMFRPEKERTNWQRVLADIRRNR